MHKATAATSHMHCTRPSWTSLLACGFLLLITGSATAASLIGQWTFEPGAELEDSTGRWADVQLMGTATVSDGKLHLHGSGTTPTGWAHASGYTPGGDVIRAKTLVAWVKLDDTSVTHGGPIAIDSQTIDNFDAIVYAERVTNRWMAGSSGFSRTQDVVTMDDTDTSAFRQMAISYEDRGAGAVRITICKDGVQLGQYDDSPMTQWSGSDAQILFGPRHSNPSGIGALEGQVEEARIYDGPMTCAEAAALPAPCPSTAVPGPMDGLVAWWPGEGDMVDGMGNGHDGVAIDGAGFDTGRVGQALAFDGVDDMFEVPYDPDFQVQEGEMSISVYLRLDGNPNEHQEIINNFFPDGSDAVPGFLFHTLKTGDEAGRLRFCWASASIPGRRCHDTTGGTVVVDGAWHHVVVVKRADWSVSIYVDGGPDEAVFEHQLTVVPAVPIPMRIGKRAAGVMPLSGRIDDLMIYNRALTVDELDDFDPDADGYGGEGCDNCPADANPDQGDNNHNGIGDECDPANDIPTLGEWAVIVLALLLMGLAVRRLTASSRIAA
jgi:hypothetical protein